MKKIISLILLVFLLVFFNACASSDLMDSYLFIQRFNKQSADFEISLSNVKSVDFDEGKKYSISVQGDKSTDMFLITLYSDSYGNIKKCGIAMSNKNYEENNPPNQSTLSEFKWILVAAGAAYTKDSIENVETILCEFGVESETIDRAPGSIYKETRQFRYAYTANILGASLSIESIRLVPTTENELTLKNH